MIVGRYLCLCFLTLIQSELAAASQDSLHASTSFIRYQTSDGSEFNRTDIIPYVEGTSCYYWVIEFEPGHGIIEIEEELMLPSPARIWGRVPGDRVKVSSDKSGAVTIRAIDLARGTASYGWCVAKGDPKGRYQFILRAGSNTLATLPFTLAETKP